MLQQFQRSLGRHYRVIKFNQLRKLFIETEPTPNPESLKFVTGKPVLPEDFTNGFYVTLNDKTEISRSPLAKALFKVEGVKSVYLGSDFITITKFAENHWPHVQSFVLSAIMDFYATGSPALLDAPEVTDTTILEDD